MTFTHPWVLLALMLPVLLVVWEARRRGTRVRLPIDYARARPPRFIPKVLLVASVLPPLVLAAVVILLAGPKRLGPPGQARVLTNIELCMDVSGSMAWPMATAPDGASRHKTAIKAIDHFTRRREGDAMGLTIFGGEVVRWVPLTRDIAAIRNAAPFIDPDTLPQVLKSTRIGHALRFCNDVLVQQPEGDRLVVLISDGESQDLGNGVAAEVGAQLAANDIVVHAIHVGDEAPPGQLTEVVTPTGGGVYSATNLNSLNAIFDHIDRMHKIRVKPTQREAIDFFGPFAWIALGGLALHTLCLFGLRYTPW